jgi:aspartate racemase
MKTTTRTLGLQGTRFTMEDPFLANPLARHLDLRCSVPGDDERAEMHRIIFDELCRGQCLDSSRQAVARMMDGLAARGCDAVVPGCTEISLLINPHDTGWPVPLIDTTAEHAQAAVDGLLETHP